MIGKRFSQKEIIANIQNGSRLDDLLESSLNVWNKDKQAETNKLKELAKTNEQFKQILKIAQKKAKETYPLRFYRLPLVLSVIGTGFIIAQSYYFAFSFFSLSIIPILIWGTIMLVSISLLNKQYLNNKHQRDLLVQSIINQQQNKISN